MRTALILLFFVLSLFCFVRSDPTDAVIVTAPAQTEVIVEQTETSSEAPQQETQTTSEQGSQPTTSTSQTGTTQATQQQQQQQQVDQFGLTAHERELFRKFELKKVEDKIALKLAKLRAKVEGKHAPHYYQATHQHPSIPYDQQQHHQFHHLRNDEHLHQDTDPSAHIHLAAQDQQVVQTQDQAQSQQAGFYGSVQLNAEEQRLYEKFLAFEAHQQLETKRQEEVAKLLKKEAKKQNVDLKVESKKQKTQKKEKKQKGGKGKGGKGKNKN
jgi:hypothetical protein